MYLKSFPIPGYKDDLFSPAKRTVELRTVDSKAIQ